MAIQEILADCWMKLTTSHFLERQILCIYAVTAENGYDIEAIYLPTFEEMCTERPHNVTAVVGSEEVLIRNIQSFFLDGFLIRDPHIYEIFTTPNVYITPRYEKMFDTCFRGDFAKKYLEETATAREYYTAEFELQKEDAPRKRDVLRNTMKRTEEFNLLRKGVASYNFYLPFKKMICSIVQLSHKEDLSNRTLSRTELFKSFTKRELVGLKAITETIGAEGSVSIVKMCQSSGCSRAVFQNAFNKMVSLGYGTVENRGAKGTYVLFESVDFFAALRAWSGQTEWERTEKKDFDKI